MQIESVRKIPCLIFGSCAFSFNLLLAFIILSVKCAHIKKYKWLLFLYSLSAMFSGLTQLLIMPHMFTNYNGFILFDGLQLLPPYIGDYMLLVYTSCFYQNLVILTHAFIYRYYAVCDPDNFGRFFKNWSKVSFFSIALLIIILISLFYVVHRSALYEEGNNEGFVMATGVNLTETGYMGGIVFTQKGLNVEMLIVLSVIVFLTLVAGLIMLKLALKIAETLKNSFGNYYETPKEGVHPSFLFLPILFDVCPGEFIILSIYFHVDTHHIAQILCCFFTAAPVIDPLVTFYLIKPYRMALVEKIHLIKAKNIKKVFNTTVVPL